MNILVIGNGFDLAHGLPTKYTDFLAFCKMIKNIYIVDERDTKDDSEIKQIWKELKLNLSNGLDNLEKLFYELNSRRTREEKCDEEDITSYYNIITTKTFNDEFNDGLYDEFYKNIKDNFWIDYFFNNLRYLKENWIDFESEISKMIKSIDTDMQRKDFEGLVDRLSNKYLEERYLYKGIEALFVDENGKRGGKQNITFKKLRNILYNDLNRLIRALEIYLCEFVEKIEPQEKSPDIDGLDVNFILSFNYTHTFSKLYDVSSYSEREVTDPFDYIHGEADINNTIDSNNMVLGIDEYLGKKKRNKHVEFIAFKKYYQRIHRETGCKYKDWINVIREENNIYMERKHDCEIYLENIEVLDHIKEKMRVKLKQLNENPPRHNLYIFGHSLDITDKDILRDLILNDNVYTTIFYHDKDTMGQQIANLVKVIGQDELIRRTGGSTKTIEFKQQQDMVPIKQEDS